jgi:hypothetical protein
MQVPVSTMIEACKRSDTAQLRRWGRQGVQLVSGEPLYQCATNGVSTDVLRCFVNDLDADVNQISYVSDGTALLITAQCGPDCGALPGGRPWC